MAFPTVDGWLWQSQWEGAGESSYAVGAKLALANVVRFQAVRNWVRARNTSNEALGWRPFRRFLASPRFRYCAQCLSTGYHAAICQLWGVSACPIHGVPLRDSCHSCSMPTPLFDLLNDAQPHPVLVPSLTCVHCRVPFGGSQDCLDIARWRAPENIQRMSDVARSLTWLQSNDLELEMANISNWGPTRPDVDGIHAQETGGKLLNFFARLCGADNATDKSGLIIPGTGDDRAYWRVRRAPPNNHDEPPQRPENCFMVEHGKYTVLPSFGVRVPVRSKIPVNIHAASLWCAQHKYQPLRTENVGEYLFRHAQYERLQASPLFWQDIQWAAWHAARRIAKEWRLQLQHLERTGSKAAKNAALLATRPEWSSRLGSWKDSNYSPVLCMTFRINGERRVFLGVPC